jgi:hypothetical protein
LRIGTVAPANYWVAFLPTSNLGEGWSQALRNGENWIGHGPSIVADRHRFQRLLKEKRTTARR